MTAGCNCGRRWTGLVQAHCSVCHLHFTTVANFDRHKPSRHGCADPATIQDRQGRLLLKPNVGSYGVTWGSAKERPGKPGTALPGSTNSPSSVSVGGLSVEPAA